MRGEGSEDIQGRDKSTTRDVRSGIWPSLVDLEGTAGQKLTSQEKPRKYGSGTAEAPMSEVV